MKSLIASGYSISIHALRKESDWPLACGAVHTHLFQSTLSVRRATVAHAELHNRLVISIHALRKESDPERANGHRSDAISIHALRKESDLFRDMVAVLSRYFNPRSP